MYLLIDIEVRQSQDLLLQNKNLLAPPNQLE